MPNIDRSEETLFLQALDCESPEQLSAFLQERCGDDAKLRAGVLQLLRHHDSSDRILDDTMIKLSADVAEELGERTGSQVGQYKLLEQIGEGGMGVVYMAEQSAPVQRKVALKIIKLGMDTKSVVARFESERQALAMMDHPNITRVLDAGATETGRPYFVMDLVRGQMITEYCDAQQMSLKQRLELFRQVCQGVQHAHQKGIIHRDLKPSNIMVTSHDGDPLPKIIDFGIAKAINQRLTEKTLFTSYGDMIGTPAYMSPEQAEMCDQDVDIRSDIYSLGVILYELLTGTTPFDLAGKSYREIQGTIKDSEPDCPSTRLSKIAETLPDAGPQSRQDVGRRCRLIRGELDWVVMRCLSKDRTQRYQTASDLADDIRRHLVGDPVDAAAPSVSYRIRKMFAKHRVAVSTGLAIAFVLLGGVVASSIFAVRAYRAAERAQEAEQLAQQLLEQTEAARTEAERERDRALFAEQQLAEMNRQQRNRAAFYRAIAKLNPDVRIEGDDKTLRAEIPMQPGLPIRVAKTSGLLATPLVKSSRLRVERTFALDQSGRRVVRAKLGTETAVLPARSIPAYPLIPALPAQKTAVTMSEAVFLKRLLTEQRREFGDQDRVVAGTLMLLGDSLLRENDHQKAVLCFRESLLIRNQTKVAAVERADAAYHLGKTLIRARQLSSGRRYLRTARSLLTSPDERSQTLRRAVDDELARAKEKN